MGPGRILLTGVLFTALLFAFVLVQDTSATDQRTRLAPRPSSAELDELRQRAQALAAEVVALRTEAEAARARAPVEAAAAGAATKALDSAIVQARQAADMASALRRRVDALEASRVAGSAVRSSCSDIGQPHVSFVTGTRNRWFQLSRLLHSIAELRIVSHECNVRVVVMDQGSTDVDTEKNVKEWSEMTGIEAEVVQVRLPQGATGFFRARALRQGIEYVFEHNPNDIVFMIDVDMVVPPHFARLARIGSERGKSAFVPVCFSLYEGSAGVVSPQHGFWRGYGFGNAGLYVSDAIELGLYNEDLTRSSHGLEDNHFVWLLKEKNIKINRPNVQGFYHIWHPRAAWGNSSNGIDGAEAIFTPRRPN